MSVPRTPAELRELALQLAVDLARNGRIATGNSSTTELPAAIVTAAETFTTFLQGPAPDPDPFLALCTYGHARPGHQGGLHDCARCSCPAFTAAFVLSESGTLVSASTGATVLPVTTASTADLICDCGHTRAGHMGGSFGCARCGCLVFRVTPQPEPISSGRTLPTGHLIGSVGAGNIADCDYCGSAVIDNGRITLAGARVCPGPDKSDDSRLERAHAWGDAVPVTGVVRCTVCLGRRWGRPFAPGDNAVGKRPCPGVPTCPACRHEAHADVCFNFASDNDCSCVFDSRTIGLTSASAGAAVHPSHDVRNAATSVQWCNTCGATIFALGVATESGAAPCEGGYSDDMDGSPS